MLTKKRGWGERKSANNCPSKKDIYRGRYGGVEGVGGRKERVEKEGVVDHERNSALST